MTSISVSDHKSNAPEQIAFAAKVIGKSDIRRKIFEEVYKGKKSIKTVEELAVLIGVSTKRILEEGVKLSKNTIFEQVKVDKKTAYQKIPFYSANKMQILNLVSNPDKLKNFSTKSNPIINIQYEMLGFPKQLIQTKRLFIDEIDSFKTDKKVKKPRVDLEKLSEANFKAGIQKIIGEKGKFTDWGGEVNDLLTSRVIYKGSRIQTAFAFKGPGTKGILTPAKMGKNGDQIQRLFKTSAELFVLQYWGQIDQAIIEQVETFAKSKSLSSAEKIFFCIIDGQDTQKIVDNFAGLFKLSK